MSLRLARPSLFRTLLVRCALSLGLAAVALPPATALAQTSTPWAEAMLSDKTYDFGIVARGADIRHVIKVNNIYKEDVRIIGLRTSCGCATATVTGQPAFQPVTIKTHESASIDVTMDTKRFTHHKDSNVIVTFDRPYAAEVWIPVKMYVRTDVVLTPSKVEFGLVDVGQEKTVTIDVAYAGQPSWKITDVRVASPYLKATADLVGQNGGSVNYKLTVQLSAGAPAGQLREEIQLVTNDTGAAGTVAVLADARIEADITVANLVLGTLTPGKKEMKMVVIRGRKPFAIEKIECDAHEDSFAVRMPEGERTVHTLPITVTPPATPGLFTETFTVTIAGRPEPITFTATGRIAGEATTAVGGE